jgi:signal transduction histidine kinase
MHIKINSLFLKSANHIIVILLLLHISCSAGTAKFGWVDEKYFSQEIAKYKEDTTKLNYYFHYLNVTGPMETPKIAFDYLSFAEKIGNKRHIASAHVFLSYNLWLSNNITLAIEHALKGIDLLKKINYPFVSAKAYNVLGILYAVSKQYDKSHFYYRKAIHFLEMIQDTHRLPRIYNNIAELYLETGKYDSAITTTWKALSFHPKLENAGIAYQNIAIAKQAMNSFDSADYYFDLALVQDDYNVIDYNLQVIRTKYAEFYIKVKNYRKALLLIDTVESFLDKKNDLNLRRATCIIKAKTYEKMRRLQNALLYYKKYMKLQDTIKYKNIDEVRMQYIYNRQYNQERSAFILKQKEKENEVQKTKYMLFSVILVTLIILLIALLIYNKYKNQNKLNKKLEEINNLKDKLFAIISHDLRGQVGAFKELAKLLNENYDELEPKQLRKYINNIQITASRLYNTLDNLLNWAWIQIGGHKIRKGLHSITEVTEKVINNLTPLLQKKNIKLLFNKNENLELFFDETAISLVISNLLTNAIKFSYEGGIVKININKDSLTIEDNGIGMNSFSDNSLSEYDVQVGTAGEQGSGLGILVSKEILQKHNWMLFFKKNEPQGTIVNIYFGENL